MIFLFEYYFEKLAIGVSERRRGLSHSVHNHVSGDRRTDGVSGDVRGSVHELRDVELLANGQGLSRGGHRHEHIQCLCLHLLQHGHCVRHILLVLVVECAATVGKVQP
jgi:hypothetical protein